jgi:hypothetical protein
MSRDIFLRPLAAADAFVHSVPNPKQRSRSEVVCIGSLAPARLWIPIPCSFMPVIVTTLSFAKNASADMSLRGNAFITVMQTAELRDLDDPADTRDLPRHRTLLVEAQMGPRSVVVSEIRSQGSLEMPGVQDHEVVQTVSSLADVVVKKRLPRLSRWPAECSENSGDGTLGDFDAEHLQFSVNSRRTPQRIGIHHPFDQPTYLGSSRRPAAWSVHPGEACPELAKALPLPAD